MTNFRRGDQQVNRISSRRTSVYERVVFVILVVLSTAPFFPSTTSSFHPTVSLFSMKWMHSLGPEVHVSRLALLVPSVVAILAATPFFPFKKHLLCDCLPEHEKSGYGVWRLYASIALSVGAGLWNGICSTAFFSFAEGWYLLLSLVVGPIVVLTLMGRSNRSNPINIALCVLAYELGVCLRFILWPDYSKLVWGGYAALACFGIIISVLTEGRSISSPPWQTAKIESGGGVTSLESRNQQTP